MVHRYQRSVLVGIGIAFAIVACLGAGWFHVQSVVRDILDSSPEKAAEAEWNEAMETIRTIRKDAVEILGEDSPEVAQLDRIIEEAGMLVEYYGEPSPEQMFRPPPPPPSPVLPYLPSIENVQK